MKTKQHEEKLPESPVVPQQVEEVPEEAHDTNVLALFSRQVNGIRPVKSLVLKRTLTKPLLAMAHMDELIFTFTSEMYTMDLPSKGRGGDGLPCRVVDGVNVATAEESILIINEMMSGAFKRGGFRTLVPKVENGSTTGYVEVAGVALKDRSFAFRAGDIKEGSNYRVVECAEVEITY